jgi:hypothetical protein
MVEHRQRALFQGVHAQLAGDAQALFEQGPRLSLIFWLTAGQDHGGIVVIEGQSSRVADAPGHGYGLRGAPCRLCLRTALEERPG